MRLPEKYPFYMRFIAHRLIFPNSEKLQEVFKALKYGPKKALLRNITILSALFISFAVFSQFSFFRNRTFFTKKKHYFRL